MYLDNQQIAIILTSVVYTTIVVIITKKVRNSKSSRIRQLWKLIVFNSILFVVGLLSSFFFLPQSFLNMLSWIVYDLIASYVIAVEVPGYSKLSRYDEACIQSLEALRNNLITIRYSFDVLEELKTNMKNNAEVISEERIDELLNAFINFCEMIKNTEINLWGLSLNEITEAINRIAQRSKHPVPILVDVLSLTGLSFLLAQILKTLE